MTEKQFNYLFSKAEELMKKSNDPVHDWSHAEQVVNKALKINNLLVKELDERIIKIAAAWHDISYAFYRKGIIQYFLEGRRSSKISRKYFKKIKLPQNETNLISDIILHHPFADLSFLGKGFLNKKRSLYHQIIQDADTLSESPERFEKGVNKESLFYKLFFRYIVVKFFKVRNKKIEKFLNLKESLTFAQRNV